MRRLVCLLAALWAAGLWSGAALAQSGSAPLRYGDVNNDGSLDVADVVRALVMLLTDAAGESVEAADVAPVHEDGSFGDGAVTIHDAVRILRWLVGLEVGLWPGVITAGFNGSLGGWTPDTADLGDPPAEWSVEPTTDAAFEGAGSLRLRLRSPNNAAKVWVGRAYGLLPNTRYRVDLSFRLGIEQVLTPEPWSVIAAVGTRSPEEADDFQRLGSTRVPGEGPIIWTGRGLPEFITTGPDGVLWVAAGVWSNFPAERDHFLDDLRFSAWPVDAPQTGGVSGRVTPPQDAVAAAMPPPGKGQQPPVYFTRVSPDGTYNLQGIPPGRYILFVSSAAARPQLQPQPVLVRAGVTLTDLSFDLSEPLTPSKQVEESFTLSLAPGAVFEAPDLPIHPDLSNPEGPAKLDVAVENQEGGTARVSLTFRYPRTADILFDEILDVIELKVWSGETLVDYVPIFWEEASAEPLNPDDELSWTATVRLPAAGETYRLDLVLWGNYE